MTQISNLTGPIDTRSTWNKVGRRQLWKGRTKFGIEFPAGAKHTDMVNVYQAKGISPEQVVQFVPVQVAEPNGSTKTVMYPESHERQFDERKELQREELFEKRIAEGVQKEEKRLEAEKDKIKEEKDSEISILKSELDDMKKMMAQLLEQKVVSHEAIKETDPYKMKFMAQRKWLKEHGVDLPKGGNAKELIAQVLEDAAESLTGS